MKYIKGVALLLWSTVIFRFSAQPAQQSSETSGVVTGGLMTLFSTFGLSTQASQNITDTVDMIVRKCAHFGVYFVLGLLALWLFTAWIPLTVPSIDTAKRYAFALGYGALYAISDEIHQVFVPGRAGRPLDVLIDTCGILLALLVWSLVGHLRNGRRLKQLLP